MFLFLIYKIQSIWLVGYLNNNMICNTLMQQFKDNRIVSDPPKYQDSMWKCAAIFVRDERGERERERARETARIPQNERYQEVEDKGYSIGSQFHFYK